MGGSPLAQDPHGVDRLDAPRDFTGLRDWLPAHPQFEGIVWHHPDGRRAKLKHRDFAQASTALPTMAR